MKAPFNSLILPVDLHTDETIEIIVKKTIGKISGPFIS